MNINEKAFLDYIDDNAQAIGYGRMMQMVSQEWRRKDPIGALMVGTAYGLVEQNIDIFNSKYRMVDAWSVVIQKNGETIVGATYLNQQLAEDIAAEIRQAKPDREVYVTDSVITLFEGQKALFDRLFYEAEESTMRGIVEVDGDPAFLGGWDKALVQLKQGRRVARRGWNGKDMWLSLVPAWSYNPSGSVPSLGLEKAPWIGMKTADNKFVPWLASQTDQLAEDWVLV